MFLFNIFFYAYLKLFFIQIFPQFPTSYACTYLNACVFLNMHDQCRARRLTERHFLMIFTSVKDTLKCFQDCSSSAEIAESSCSSSCDRSSDINILLLCIKHVYYRDHISRIKQSR